MILQQTTAKPLLQKELSAPPHHHWFPWSGSDNLLPPMFYMSRWCDPNRRWKIDITTYPVKLRADGDSYHRQMVLETVGEEGISDPKLLYDWTLKNLTFIPHLHFLSTQPPPFLQPPPLSPILPLPSPLSNSPCPWPSLPSPLHAPLTRGSEEWRRGEECWQFMGRALAASIASWGGATASCCRIRGREPWWV